MSGFIFLGRPRIPGRGITQAMAGLRLQSACAKAGLADAQAPQRLSGARGIRRLLRADLRPGHQARRSKDLDPAGGSRDGYGIVRSAECGSGIHPVRQAGHEVKAFGNLLKNAVTKTPGLGKRLIEFMPINDFLTDSGRPCPRQTGNKNETFGSDEPLTLNRMDKRMRGAR
jgi:hypothetical protein